VDTDGLFNWWTGALTFASAGVAESLRNDAEGAALRWRRIHDDLGGRLTAAIDASRARYSLGWQRLRLDACAI